MNIEVAKIVGAVFATYPNIQASDETIRIYVRLLEDIPVETLKAAVEEVLCNSKFLPTPAEIRQQAFELTSAQDGNGMTKWGDVKEQFRVAGYYRRPKFTDPLVAKAVDILGWQQLCSSENEEASRAHFAKIYDDLRARAIREAKLAPKARALREELKMMKEIGDGKEF